MDDSVSNFYGKNAESNYAKQYEIDHGPRLDAMIIKWNLREELKNSKVLDVGGGLGFLGKRFDPHTHYHVIDGAEVPNEQKLCAGVWTKADLDYDKFATANTFDAAFCLETLEHLTNPYNCLAEIKKMVKMNGHVYISIPHFNVTHNYIYPGLMADPNVFAQFLGQMALPVIDYWLWDKGWNAHHFKCLNLPYSQKMMLFPKEEAKFINATPVEMVNW